jgi:cytochrome c5
MRNALKFLAVLTAITVPLLAEGSDTKGKYFFKKSCKSCHAPGGVGKEVTPLVKTQAQWKAYFAAGKHNKGTEPLSKVAKPDQVKDIQTFLTAHASDSPQPMTCG